jgi:tetratricopeptide (TPR) repeat protein
LSRWEDAAADFDLWLKVRPPHSAEDLAPLALLRAYLGDRDGYRQVCRRMVEQFGKDPKAVWVVADAISLAPNDAADPVETQQQLGRLLQPPGRGEWPNYVTYGLASIRAGKPEEALQVFFGPPEKAGVPGPAAFLIEALASHRLGRADKARAYLENANHVAEPSSGWADALRFRILFREADAAINAPHRREAEECLRNKQWKEAVDHLDALLKADADFWPDLTARGVAYAALGEQEKAKADFQKADKLSSGSLSFRRARGRLYVEAGLRDQAAEDFAEVLSPKRAGYDARLETYAELARDEKLLLAVAAMRPNDHELRMSCGSLLEQQGKWQTALTLYGEAARLEDPDDKKWPATMEHGRLAVQHEQWADAAADFSRARERSPDPLVWHQAALLYLQTGDAEGYQRSCRLLQRDFEANHLAAAHGMLPWSCMFGSDAVDDFNPLLKLAGVPDNRRQDWGEVQLAALLYRAGRFQEAAQHFDEMKADPVKGRYAVIGWFFRAMTAHRLGRAEDARRWLEKAADWMSDAEQAKLPPKEKMAAWAWNERLELSLLRREAEAVLKEPAPRPDK